MGWNDFFGNQQDVDGCLGVDVMKYHAKFVLVDDPRGNLFVGDFLEDIVGQHVRFPPGGGDSRRIALRHASSNLSRGDQAPCPGSWESTRQVTGLTLGPS